ncbi:MAG TPA: hypothetical protein VN257_11890, partial [Actinotalea sp.]|nr:hypothetical protein [Actinotalea sp.]
APPPPAPLTTGSTADGHPAAPSPVDPVGPAVAPPDAPADAPADDPPDRPHRERRSRWPVVTLSIATVLGLVAAGYLWHTSDAWQVRAEEYLRASQSLGAELATTRTDLLGARAELEAVRGQLATAQARIVELADEKAQLGDDREVQRQLVDYQERVTEAAGRVAGALDQCVQGQNQLIGYMANAEQYDPVELDQYATSVQELCQTATEANIALQRELAR